LIDHKDIDELAGDLLVQKKVRAVININSSITGRYPNVGPKTLVESGIYLIDQVNEGIWEKIYDGDEIVISGNNIYKHKELAGTGEVLDLNIIKDKLSFSCKNLENELDRFVQNTLDYALKEKELITGKLKIPKINTEISGKHVLVVVRGQNYKEDLKTILSYIQEVKPVIIGVDGGADAVREFGLKPHIIIGDMDSVNDETLKTGAEIIVHAYPDGRAPGMERIEKLGLKAKVFSAPGTSEDIAMLLAYEKQTELIVAIGTHSNMIDFLEKGRKGMASTFLVRLKVGNKLVDAKGVNQLYQSKLNTSLVVGLFLAAFIPILVLILFSPRIQYIIHLFFLKLRLGLGGG